MATTTNYNWSTPDDTSLIKDGAAAIRTLGSAIDTSLVDLKGGTTGQVLSKATNTDLDYSWITPAAAGTVVKVQSTVITSSAFRTTSTSFVDVTNYSVSITPTANTSKILIIASYSLNQEGAVGVQAITRLLRDSTAIVDPVNTHTATNNSIIRSNSFTYLDSPATTSAITYKIQLKSTNAAEGAIMGSNYNLSPVYPYSITAIEIGA